MEEAEESEVEPSAELLGCEADSETAPESDTSEFIELPELVVFAFLLGKSEIFALGSGTAGNSLSESEAKL